MAAKKKSKFENKFRSTATSESRTANVRDERKVKDEQPKLSFNFKDFDFNQCPPGQTLEKWQEEKMLDKLVGRFVEVCSFTRQEAVQQGLLKVYGDFPENSHFKIPPHIKGKVSWGTIRKIGGQKPRLAGYIIESVFYPFWTKTICSILLRRNIHKQKTDRHELLFTSVCFIAKLTC